MSRVGGWLAAPIRGYQRWVSPALPPSCRFEPSCSAYAIEALSTRGPLVGLALTGWRLLRCAPWGRGGWDPVPPRRRTLRMTRRTPGTLRPASRARWTSRPVPRSRRMSRPAVPETSRSLRREPSVVS